MQGAQPAGAAGFDIRGEVVDERVIVNVERFDLRVQRKVVPR